MDKTNAKQDGSVTEEGYRQSFSPSYVSKVSESRRAHSSLESITTGTGYEVYNSMIIPAMYTAKHEIIFVTCFWAASATLDNLRTLLLQLSDNARASSPPSKIKVRICFSSKSLVRNMLVPTPKEGQHYGPKHWKKLDLPEQADMPGLDVSVIRKFFWPFGIIHSKYAIIDRKLAIIPSCNVSWERWFETAITMKGEVVKHLLDFHTLFWLDGRALPELPSTNGQPTHSNRQPLVPVVQTTLLPSPHTPSVLPPRIHSSLLGILHRQSSPRLAHPRTALLLTTTHLLDTARQSIILITPNVTAPSVLTSLSMALSRGVRVTIYTNRTLMTLEQIVTAGTTTPLSLSRLHKRMASRRLPHDLLRINYFDDPNSGPGGMAAKAGITDVEQEVTPVKLHAKVTIIDGELLLLGSCNMDAASWYTSQELGVLLEGREIVEEWKKKWPYGKLDS